MNDLGPQCKIIVDFRYHNQTTSTVSGLDGREEKMKIEKKGKGRLYIFFFHISIVDRKTTETLLMRKRSDMTQN